MILLCLQFVHLLRDVVLAVRTLVYFTIILFEF